MTEPSRIHPSKAVKKDLVMVALLLALCIVLMFVNFWYTTVKDRHDKLYIAISGELRILSQSIAKHASNASDGVQDAFELLQKNRDGFDDGLLTLRNGDARFHIPAAPLSIRQNELKNLEQSWSLTRDRVDVILGRQDLLYRLHQMADELNQVIPRLQERYSGIIQLLVSEREDQNNVLVASKQAILAQQMTQNIEQVLQGGEGAVEAADAFSRNALLFGKRLQAMQKGMPALSITKVQDPKVMSSLRAINEEFKVVMENIKTIQTISSEYALVNQAAFDIYLGSQALLEQSTTLSRAFRLAPETRFIGEPTGYMLGATCILLFAWLSYLGYANARVNLLQTENQHRANRKAVWQLLEELDSLADGDLRVRATVGDDITGAIAESVNFAIDALRKLVFTINETAMQVSTSAQQSQATSIELAQASEVQAREIVGATAAITAMARSIEHVSANASESEAVAKESVDVAKSGVKAVHDTMVGMDKIRAQMQQTSKQIKRLGESTQEIGHIISLINDIADQTQILALNASIQATMAGEAGKGFAVVAQEVQRLAERATAATQQVESLVTTIQSDTNETVRSVEQTTQEVVVGADLARHAGESLTHIESVSMHLAELISQISASAEQQTNTSAQVTSNMEVIKGITSQSSRGASETAQSIGQLAELAIELRESVAGFKLPAREVDSDDDELNQRAG